MKKSTSLLLAGLTVLGLSGFTSCESNDPVADSVLLAELTNGYKITGTGHFGGSYNEVNSIIFCDWLTDFEFSDNSHSTNQEFSVDGNLLYLGEFGYDVDTSAVGTPGRLEVGVGYYDDGTPDDIWTITGIEQVECLVN